jgi:hypothetical protein
MLRAGQFLAKVDISLLNDTVWGFLQVLPQTCADLLTTSIPTSGTVSCSYSLSHTTIGSYENTASVTVRDNEGSTSRDTDSETVSVTDVNEPPMGISLSATSVAENQLANTTVGTLSATGPDAGETFTFSLPVGPGGADNGSFNLSGNTLRTNARFDYETKFSYSILVRVSDRGGLFYDK